MSPTVAPLGFHAPLVQEDEARAGYYALLGRLLYAGPDADLLQSIAGSAEIAAGGQLAGPWNALAAAARAMDTEAARAEYDELFVGTGKAQVTPYAAFIWLRPAGRKSSFSSSRTSPPSVWARRAPPGSRRTTSPRSSRS